MSGFKITGLGEYRTRGGEKAVIKWLHESSNWPWLGEIPSVGAGSWNVFGFWGAIPCIYDIIGPWVEPTVDKPTTPDHAKLIASLELAAHHNDCSELLLDAAREIERLRSLMEERAAHNGLGAGSIPAASTSEYKIEKWILDV